VEKEIGIEESWAKPAPPLEYPSTEAVGRVLGAVKFLGGALGYSQRVASGSTRGLFAAVRGAGRWIALPFRVSRPTEGGGEGRGANDIDPLLTGRWLLGLGRLRGGESMKERLRAYQEKLRELASQLLLAEERERRVIAEELHDRVGQNLALLKNYVGALRGNPPAGCDEAKLEEIQSLIERTISDTRSLTFEVSIPVLYEVGLVGAVDWLSEQMRDKYGSSIRVEKGEGLPAHDDDVRVILFRSTRELLFNVVKHADAKETVVSIRGEGESIRIDVVDDGVGFDPGNPAGFAPRGGGFGLFSIRERLENLGGRLDIVSSPGEGTTVSIRVPCVKRATT
jgi:signal transduction histidine kinase